MTAPSVLVTGAGGYLGSQLVAALAAGRIEVSRVVAADVREVPPDKRLPGIDYVQADVRSPALIRLFDQWKVDVVVHLASIVTPGRDSSRQFEYSVDVQGTENVLIACTTTGVKKVVVSSSGAAYGYHADNLVPLTEDCPLRGNEAFAYALYMQGLYGVTAKVATRFRQPVHVGEKLIIRAWTLEQRRRLMDARAEIRLATDGGPLVAEADATMYLQELAEAERPPAKA